MSDAIPFRIEGATFAIRVRCDGRQLLAGAVAGSDWRKVLDVPPDRDLWCRCIPDDMLVQDDPEIGYAFSEDSEFFTAPRRISDS